jgi:hypothetical protein
MDIKILKKMLNNDKTPFIITIEEFYYSDVFLSNCIYDTSIYLTVRKGTGVYDEHDSHEEKGQYNLRDQNSVLYLLGNDEDINSFLTNSSEISSSEYHNSIYVRKNFLCDNKGNTKLR